MSSTVDGEREKKSMKWKTEQKILLNLNNKEKIDVKEKGQTLKELWTYNKRSNIHVIRVSEREQKSCKAKKYPKKAENIPNLARDIQLQIRFKKLCRSQTNNLK